jgi:hypothetical protein
MYDIVSHCPQCGAPIYVETPWWSVTPPPPHYTCSCTAHLRQVVTTTNIIWHQRGEHEEGTSCAAS